jgi:hypothetical protein
MSRIAGVAVDDLLRRADGQRRHLGEVLHRRAVAVDRGVVEVRTELVHGILRVLRHERLAAEADDRRLRRAVAVVLPALAVQTDEALVVLGGQKMLFAKKPSP